MEPLYIEALEKAFPKGKVFTEYRAQDIFRNIGHPTLGIAVSFKKSGHRQAIIAEQLPDGSCPEPVDIVVAFRDLFADMGWE